MADPVRGLRVVLASASPRRLDLLRLAGIEPVVRPPDVDERPHADEDATAYVARLARAKAVAVPRAADEVVVAADTTVTLDGEPIGKPADAADAAAMLRRLSGRPHAVVTGVAVVGPSGTVWERAVETTVVMAPLTPREIAAYIASGEPLDKAGGYAIQGRGAVLVQRLEGSWTNVVGLPVVETVALLRSAGWRRG